MGTRTGDAGTDLVLVTDRNIVVIDSENTHTEVYTFDTTEETRRAQFAEVAGVMFITTTTGAFPGRPEKLLELRELDCRDCRVPMLPSILAETATDISDGGLGSTGPRVYCYRWAYEMADGGFGPPSSPMFFSVGVASNDGWRIRFAIQDYPDSDNPAYDSGLWSDRIRGIALFISQGVDATGTGDLQKASEQPLFYAGSFGSVLAGSLVLYEGTEEALSSGLVMETDNLWQHNVSAGACFSYNQTLILGDAGYDFRKPNALLYVPGSFRTRQLPGDYAVILSVEIRTNKGAFVRYSDPVYVDAGIASSISMRGVYNFASSSWSQTAVCYPDPRVVSISVWVDNDGSGGFNFHSEHAAAKSAGGNLSYATIPALDLTASLGALLDEGTRLDDRDPNRILVSREFTPYNLPASRAVYSNRSDSDAVIAFAANTATSEEGQYGEAPVIALGAETVRGLRLAPVTVDAMFSGAFPIAEKGLVGRNAYTNSEGIVFYASADGVWTLAPHISRRPVSWSVQSDGATDDIMSDLGENTVMEFIDDNRGNRDLWVFTTRRAWVYATEYGRWFTVDRRRSAAVRDGNSLYTYDVVSKSIQEEVQHPNDGSVGVASLMRLETYPLRMGLPSGTWRRLYRFGIRMRKAIDQISYRITDPVSRDELSGISDLTTQGDLDNAGVEYESVTTIVDEEVEAIGYAEVTGAGSVEVTGSGFLEVVTGAVVVDGHKRFPRASSYEATDEFPLEVIEDGEAIVHGADTMVVANGVLQSETTDVQSFNAALCREPIVSIEARGKFGQAVEAISFDIEPRYMHRARKQNY